MGSFVRERGNHVNRGYRGCDALAFTLLITPTNGNALESSFFWVEMKGLISFRIPLKRKKAYYEGEKKIPKQSNREIPRLGKEQRSSSSVKRTENHVIDCNFNNNMEWKVGILNMIPFLSRSERTANAKTWQPIL